MRNRTLLALFLALAAQALVFLLFFPPLSEPDTASFVSVAVQALNTGSFQADTRLPGYPAFLAVLYAFFGQGGLAVIIVQHLLGLLLWFLFVKLFETDRQRVIFSVLYFCDLLYSSYQHAILSDFLFSFLICLSAWAARLYSRDRRPYWLLLCGLLVGLGIMTKPALKLFYFFVLPVFLAERRPFKARLASVALFLAGPLLIVNLWSYRNYRLTGTYSLMPMESYHYIGRIVNHAEFPENSVAKKYIMEQMPEGRVPRSRRSAVVHAAEENMRRDGIKTGELDSEFREIFKLSILRRPFSYARESAVELFYFFFSAHNLYAKYALGDRLPVAVDRGAGLSGALLKVAVSLHPFYWLVFFLMLWHAASNAGALWRGRDLFLLYSYALIVYIALVSSMANEGLARYRGALHPLMLFTAALALGSLFPGKEAAGRR